MGTVARHVTVLEATERRPDQRSGWQSWSPVHLFYTHSYVRCLKGRTLVGPPCQGGETRRGAPRVQRRGEDTASPPSLRGFSEGWQPALPTGGLEPGAKKPS